MSARGLTLTTGTVILLMGLAGLFYPDRVMGLLGFTVLNTTQSAAVLGEVRATYGGLFTVMGAAVVLAALNPAGNRGRLLAIGLLWLGACGGRLLGVAVDGNPGVFGWLAVVFEGAMGSALLLAAQRAGSALVAEAAPGRSETAAPVGV
jgi:hypothetical protein